jgi:PPP5 TPR repeat region/Calcineurin-like phosphoesterase
VLNRVYFKTQPKHGTFVRAENLTPYTAESEAAAKLGSVMKMAAAKKRKQGEVLFRAFNTLDASDESALLARRQALMNSALGSKLTRDRPSPETIAEWEKEAASMVIPPEYTGPHLTFPLSKPEEIVNMINAFKAGEVLHYKYALSLIAGYARYAAELPTLVPVTVESNTRLTLVGDTHGQYQDLLSIFALNGIPNLTNRYLFNGDFVDRGTHSIEIVLTLFAFCLLYPGAKGTSAGGGCLLNRG